MADIDLKTETPDTSLPTTGFLFGADSQAASVPSVYSAQTVATTLLGPTTPFNASITADAPVLNLAQTWNASGVTFTGLRFNAATGSNAGSAAGSLLMDLQLEGTSKVKVGKNGGLALGGGSLNTNEFNTSTSGGLRFGSGIHGLFPNGSTEIHVIANGTTTIISSSTTTRINSGKFVLGAADAAAPVAQTLSVQSVVAGTTNTAGANLTITGSQGTGTGAGGSIVFQVAPAGTISGGAVNALATALTIDSAKNAIFAGDILAPGGSNFNTTGTTFSYNFLVSSAPVFGMGLYYVGLASNSSLRWSSTTNPHATPDTILTRDAANTLALRNGTAAQRFNVYNTYTSSTNYEVFKIDWITTANTVLVGTEKGSGGGTARALELQTNATSRLTLDTVGSARIVTALTVATLPGTPLAGMIARVTDALAPTIGMTVTGGGAAYALVNYNGANWTVIGV